jgi:hypothetical protein
LFPNHSWNADRLVAGVSHVWYLCRLSTRTNQRAVYFFCQKYYKPRNSQKHYSRKYTIHAKTLLPQKHYFRKTRKNWFLEMRKIWFTKFHEYTIHERIRERESVLTVRYDQFWDSEIGKLSLTPTLLFIDFGNHQNDQNTPQNRPWIVHGRKWPFCPQAQNSIFVFWAFI